MMDREDIQITVKTYWYLFVGLACLIIFVTAIAAMRPVWMGFEREAVKNSHQYVEGSETAILNWIQAYEDADAKIADFSIREDADTEPIQKIIQSLEAQKTSNYRRVKTRAARVGQDKLSPEVREFLARHQNQH